MKIWPMFCKACGQGIDRGDKFCRNCGVPLPQEPIESAVAASASAAQTAEAPIAVATSTAELQRPLPIPKAQAAEASTAVEEKQSASATAPPASDAGTTASPDQPRDQAPSIPVEAKAEAAEGQMAAKLDAAGVSTKEPSASSEAPSQPAPEGKAESAVIAAQSASSVVALPPSASTGVPSQPQAPATASGAAAAQPASEPKVESPAVPAQQSAAVESSAMPAQAALPLDDNDHAAGSRPVRLCPQCHRLVGENDLVCERCKAKLDGTVTEPSSAPDDYGVPSFGGYANDKKAGDSVPEKVSDPSGLDAIANLRIRRRRGLSVVEIIVAVVLLGGAGVAVWMLRSSLPDKTAPATLNVAVTVVPARARVVAGHGYDFSATVTGTDNFNVDWSVDEGDTGGRVIPRGAKAKDGAVSSLAVYMAPKTPGTYHVTATSKGDPGKSASAIITVTGK